jgi:acylphosphatase
MMNVRVSLTVRGKVQGVAFRKQTMRKAEELNVSGWVRNLSDGSVQGCFEGAETNVEALVVWCSIGPERARVDAIESESYLYTGEFTDFQIWRDGEIPGGGCS